MGVEGVKAALWWITNKLYYQRFDLFVLVNLFVLGYIGVFVSSGLVSLAWTYAV